MNSKKKRKRRKACLLDSRLGFSTKANPKRELIFFMSNLRKCSCHRSYTLWKKGLNGLSFDSQSSESGYVKRERNRSLLMHAFVPTIHIPSLIFFPVFLSILSNFVRVCFYFLFSLFFLSPLHPFHYS